MQHKQNRLLFILFFITICYLKIPAYSNEPVNLEKNHNRLSYIPGEIIVKYKKNLRKSSATRQYKNNFSTIRKFRHTRCEHLRLPPGMTVAQALETFADDPDVLYVEPNYIRRQMAVTPNDPDFNVTRQWGLMQIDMPDAWEWGTDCSDIIIAVIDSGIDYTHPDLSDNLWINAGEIENNGIDDDGNGYVDDIHGWNFISMNATNNGDNNIYDSNGHGTHVSGVLAAVGNNTIGIAGVCWTARIMVLKFLNENGVGSSAAEVAAIEYAIDHGARIINASFGEEGYIQSERDAIAAARQQGILFVAAAGNNWNNNDGSNPNYPASYTLDNIISVAASKGDDELEWWSSYGAVSVDVAAPGVKIYAPYPGALTPIWDENFEESVSMAFWTFQDAAWSRTSAQHFFGSYALSINPINMASSETSAITPVNDVSGKTAIKLEFYLLGNSQSHNQRLFVETAPSPMGPWTNQVLETASPDGNMTVYDQGVAGTDLPSEWVEVSSSLTLTDGSDALYIRFRLKADTSGGSDSDNGLCFVGTAWADIFPGAWYIDFVILQGVDPTENTSTYGYLDGTSSATPFVSGLAGLIWNSFPTLTGAQVKAAILNGVDPVYPPSDYPTRTISGGRINANTSLSEASTY